MQLTKEKSELIARFENLLEGIDNSNVIAALCAKIAEEYHKEQVKSVDLANVSGRSEQFYCGKHYYHCDGRCDNQCNDCKTENTTQ